MLGAIMGWLNAAGVALGLVREVKDLVEGESDPTVPDCPATLRDAEIGQASGAAANASQAATTEHMRRH